MPKFLVLYRSSLSAGEQMSSLSSDDRQASMRDWMDWAERGGGSIVEMGAPLGEALRVGSPSTLAHITGFSIVEVHSKDDALELLDGHPHLNAPGENSIEALEFMTPPGDK